MTATGGSGNGFERAIMEAGALLITVPFIIAQITSGRLLILLAPAAAFFALSLIAATLVMAEGLRGWDMGAKITEYLRDLEVFSFSFGLASLLVVFFTWSGLSTVGYVLAVLGVSLVTTYLFRRAYRNP
jgi:hypothetical protein